MGGEWPEGGGLDSLRLEWAEWRTASDASARRRLMEREVVVLVQVLAKSSAVSLRSIARKRRYCYPLRQTIHQRRTALLP